LGASVSVDIKVNDIALALGEAVANKVAKQIPIKPVYLKEKGILNVTIKGGVATGELLILPEYVNVGY
ncbi:hypothetical protein IG604_14120, partial [Vibrio cholerae]|nr:hypothetical protein [Vibrio cholerae]